MVEKVHAYSNWTKKDDFQVLDLATGRGEPGETIARQFPRAFVVATDISPDQIALAQETTATLPHMTAQVADMQDLHQFEDNSFDIVTCCYGFTFPANIPKAISESYRVLKPGGQLIATTWNRVKMMEKVRLIMDQVLGGTPSPITPLCLSEPGLFESMLAEAGYVNLASSTHEYPFDFTKDPGFQFKAAILPVRHVLEKTDGGMDMAKKIYESIKMDHAQYNDHGHYILPGNEYKLTVATK